MTPDETDAAPPHGDRAKTEREARLAAALRDNLRRRKAQARGTDAPSPPAAPPPNPDVTP